MTTFAKLPAGQTTRLQGTAMPDVNWLPLKAYNTPQYPGVKKAKIESQRKLQAVIK